MKKRGRHAWLPSIVIDEIEDLQRDREIKEFSTACRETIKYAKIGREVERLMRFDFKNASPFKKMKRGGFL
jgi:hypothetical protein